MEHAKMNILEMQCARCGGALQITPEMDRFTCGYCGTAQTVQRRGGTVVLKLVTDAIEKVQAGTDRTAAELALLRLKSELAEINQKLANPEVSLPKEIAAIKTAALTGTSQSGSEILAIVIFSVSVVLFLVLFIVIALNAETVSNMNATGYILLFGSIVVMFFAGRKAFGRNRALVRKGMEGYRAVVAGHVAALNSQRVNIIGQIEETQALLRKPAVTAAST